MALTSPPEQGQIVEVRQRRYVVADVAKSTLARSPLEPSFATVQHLVSLASVEDDALGEELQVIWELEPGAHVYDQRALPSPTGLIDRIAWMHSSTQYAGMRPRRRMYGPCKLRFAAALRLRIINSIQSTVP